MLIEAEIHAAAAVAAKIHRNDTRKYSGLPYLTASPVDGIIQAAMEALFITNKD